MIATQPPPSASELLEKAVSTHTPTERALCEGLKKLFKELVEKDGFEPFGKDLEASVINGVLHLERMRISWREAASSYRHTVRHDCLCAIIATGRKSRALPNHREAMLAIKLPPDTGESTLGLPWRELKEGPTALMYLWLSAARFIETQATY